MKRNELMIGDWVTVITDEGADINKQWSINDYIDTNADYCEPIPLTGEILEANGFVKDGYTNLSPDYYLETKGGYSICVNLHTTCDKRNLLYVSDRHGIEQREIICYGGRNIRKWYVHKLQRALRCADLFDLADNFKVE